MCYKGVTARGERGGGCRGALSCHTHAPRESELQARARVSRAHLSLEDQLQVLGLEDRGPPVLRQAAGGPHHLREVRVPVCTQ